MPEVCLEIAIEPNSTDKQLADQFTKHLTSEKFLHSRKDLMGCQFLYFYRFFTITILKEYTNVSNLLSAAQKKLLMNTSSIIDSIFSTP